MSTKHIKGYVMVLLSAIIYGCMPLGAKYIYAEGVNPITLVFLRNLLALPTLGALAFFKEKSLSCPKKALPSVCLLSLLGCCLTPWLLFSSYNHMASGSATVVHFIYPALVAVGGAVFFKEKLKPAALISVILCVAGISLFYDPSAAFSLKGALLAFLSGVTFATYVLLLQRFKWKKELQGFRFSFYIALVSSAFMLVFCLVTRTLSLPATLLGWVLSFAFATFVTAIAVVLFQQGTFIIGGARASVLSSLEPITSVAVGFAVFSEPLGIPTVTGSLLVVSASIMIALSDMKKVKK